MNIILNCCAEKGRAGYTVEVGGRVVEKQAYNITKDASAKLKEFTFDAVIKGLKVARNYVSHEDLLLIGVPNAHMAEWLNGSKEYKGYELYLDEISDIIETLDCRYLFAKCDMRRTKKILKDFTNDEKLTGLDSLMAELE